MPAFSHIGLGFAAKRAAPNVSIFILIGAALAVDILYGIFSIAGGAGFLPADTLAWSHSLPMAVLWSIGFALLAGLISRNRPSSVIIGLLVFSHWILDFLMWPPNASLFYPGGPEIGLDLGRSWIVDVVFEFGVLILGIAVYIRTRSGHPSH